MWNLWYWIYDNRINYGIRFMVMDLSEAYDSLPNDLLVAKFEACGIDKYGLILKHNT